MRASMFCVECCEPLRVLMPLGIVVGAEVNRPRSIHLRYVLTRTIPHLRRWTVRVKTKELQHQLTTLTPTLTSVWNTVSVNASINVLCGMLSNALHITSLSVTSHHKSTPSLVTPQVHPSHHKSPPPTRGTSQGNPHHIRTLPSSFHKSTDPTCEPLRVPIPQGIFTSQVKHFIHSFLVF
jgi:hypothetical protein